MLKPIRGGSETYWQHICDKLYTKHQQLEIYLHDIHASAIDKKTNSFIGDITFCPYCGQDPDREERRYF